MKTSTAEVLCDVCTSVIPVMAPEAIFVTLRGSKVGHKKLDFCGRGCLARWAEAYLKSWPLDFMNLGIVGSEAL